MNPVPFIVGLSLNRCNEISLPLGVVIVTGVVAGVMLFFLLRPDR